MVMQANRPKDIARGTRARSFQPSPTSWQVAVCSCGVIGLLKRVVPKYILRKKWIGFLNMLRPRHDDRRQAGKNAISQLAHLRAATFSRWSVGQNTFR